MKRLRVMIRILKATHVDRLIMGFAAYILVMAAVLLICEPNVTSYFDGIWYCFVTFATVGFGDIVVKTVIGKILSMILMVYGMIIVALMTGTIVSYYQEIQKLKAKDTVTAFMDKLERLPELSQKELQELSENIKKRRNKM